MRGRIALLAVLSLAVAGSAVVRAPLAHAAGAGPGCDLTTDGAGDIAVGVPGDVVHGVAGAGGIDLISEGGGFTHTFLSGWYGGQHDNLGTSIACGDFNGDGVDDVAAGAPGADGGTGRVYVWFGGPGGPAGGQSITQLDVDDTAEKGSGFGQALAAGDFNGDGIDDLAIAEQYHNYQLIPDVPGAWPGAVRVIAGGPRGLGTRGLSTDHLTIEAPPSLHTYVTFFAATIATGDFNGDGLDDLVVGAPRAKSQHHVQAGTAVTYLGNRGRLIDLGSAKLLPTQEELGGTSGDFDGFGGALEAGDFDGDGDVDLAVGVPFDDHNRGEVYLIRGTGTGLSAADAVRYTSGNVWVNEEDWYGYSLAAGDFDGDGTDELAIGMVRGIYCYNGEVEVRELGGYTRLLTEPTGCYANFGYGLGASDVNGDGTVDLVVGAPGVEVQPVPYAGVVYLYEGGAEGLGKYRVRYDQYYSAPGYVEEPTAAKVGSPFKWLPGVYLDGEAMGAAVAG